VRMDWSGLLGERLAAVVPASYSPTAGTPGDPAAAKERRLEQILLGRPVSEKTRATVIGESNDNTVTEQAQTQFDLTPGGGKAGLKYMPRGMRPMDGPNTAPDDAQAALMAGLLLGSPEFQRR